MARSLAEMCESAAPQSQAEAEALIDWAGFAASAPDLADLAPVDPEWRAQEAELARVLQAGRRNRDIRRNLTGTVRPEVWERDLKDLRRDVADAGSRWWRFLSGRWRRLKAEVASLCEGPGPRDLSAMLGLLDAVVEAARCQAVTNEGSAAMAGLFRSGWKQAASDWELLELQAA